MADTPILDLKTLVERPFIRVDGKSYELFAPSELTIMASQRFMRRGKRIEELAKSSNEDDEVDTELQKLIDEVARAALVDMPEAVFSALPERARWQIVEVFTTLLSGPKRTLAAAIVAAAFSNPAQEKSKATGAKPSRGSAGSTGARRNTGSKKRRRRS